MFGLTLAIFYHLANGIRHLVWDAGHGFDVEDRQRHGRRWSSPSPSPPPLAVWVHRRHDGSALMASYRTPLGRARGLGSAKHGVGALDRRAGHRHRPGPAGALGASSACLRLAAGDYDGAVAWLARRRSTPS